MKPDKAKPQDNARNLTLWLVGLATLLVVFGLLKRDIRILVYGSIATGLTMRVVAVWIHEGGHALFAFLTGLRIHQVQVGSMRFLHLRHGWERQKVAKPKGLGGYVIVSPERLRGLRTSFVLFCLGGVLAELLMFLPLFILFRSSFWANWAHESILAHFFYGLNLSFCIQFLISVPLNLFPKRLQGIGTDGMVAFSMIFRTPFGERFMALLHFSCLSNQGVRPRDMPADLVAVLEASDRADTGMEAHWLIRWHLAADRGDHAAMEVLWKDAQATWEKLPAHSRRIMGLHHAWYLAAQLGQPIPGELIDPGTTLGDSAGLLALVRAFQAQQQGMKDEARAFLQAAMQRMEAGFPTALDEMFKESGMALAARLDAA